MVGILLSVKEGIHQPYIITEFVTFQNRGSQTLHHAAADLTINEFFVDDLTNIKGRYHFENFDITRLHVNFDVNRVSAKSQTKAGAP